MTVVFAFNNSNV